MMTEFELSQQEGFRDELSVGKMCQDSVAEGGASCSGLQGPGAVAQLC